MVCSQNLDTSRQGPKRKIITFIFWSESSAGVSSACRFLTVCSSTDLSRCLCVYEMAGEEKPRPSPLRHTLSLTIIKCFCISTESSYTCKKQHMYYNLSIYILIWLMFIIAAKKTNKPSDQTNSPCQVLHLNVTDAAWFFRGAIITKVSSFTLLCNFGFSKLWIHVKSY